MPQGDGSERKCFDMWKQGMTISEINCKTTAKPESVKHWVTAWERGAQGQWDILLKE